MPRAGRAFHTKSGQCHSLDSIARAFSYLLERERTNSSSEIIPRERQLLKSIALCAILGLFLSSAMAQDIVVFDDTLGAGIQTWTSWGGGVDLANAAPVHGGAKSIRFAGNNYNALSVSRPGAPISATAYPYAHFWVHGGTGGTQQFEVTPWNGSASLGKALLDDYVRGGYIAPGQWREVSIPLDRAPFSASASYDRLDFQSVVNGSQAAIYIDDFTFTSTSTPAFVPDSIFNDDMGKGHWVGGYYVGYERALNPLTEVDFSAITHLVVGRVRPLGDGNIVTEFDIDAVHGPHWAKLAVAIAHENRAKALLMIGGAGEHNGWVGATSSVERRRYFVDQLLGAVGTFGADGIDIDWEPLETADRPALLALVRELRARRPNLLIAMPLGWINGNIVRTPDAYWAELAAELDHFNIMTYDMAGPWSEWDSWHSSATYGEAGTRPSSARSSVNYYLVSGVPASKLGIGIPFYGTCWTGVAEPYRPIPANGSVHVVASDGIMSYRNIINSYYSAVAARWDDVAKVPYLSSTSPIGPAGCNFLSYEDAQSIHAKGAFIRENGLGGTIIWTIGQGHLSAPVNGTSDPLLDAVRETFAQ
jgi:chitinase